MGNTIVDISDMKVTDRAEDTLVTYSLGSCVGLTLYDPVAGIGGMAHCMLPLSKLDPRKARETPCMFVDTGIQALLEALFARGVRRRRLVAKVAGCASSLDHGKMFRIGERNCTVLRKILWKNDILLAAEDLGGTHPRTMFLYMEDGQTTIKAKGREKVL